MHRSIASFVCVTIVLAQCATAQFGYGSHGGDRNGCGCPPWVDDCGNGDDGSGSYDGGSSSSGFSQGALFSNPAERSRANRVLVAHAVLASLVWVIFVPSLAILLRLKLKNPVVVKVHAVGQIFSYILFVVAAGMGIWLAQQTAPYGSWSDAHPRLGLAILALAFFQPILGAVHHSIYKKRTRDAQASKICAVPSRTAPGFAHVWLGRSLIILGIINGGLGIRLASFSPFQTDATSTKAKIAYGVIAGIMFLLYLLSVVMFEVRKRRSKIPGSTNRVEMVRNKDGLPTYDESEESLARSSPVHSH